MREIRQTVGSGSAVPGVSVGVIESYREIYMDRTRGALMVSDVLVRVISWY